MLGLISLLPDKNDKINYQNKNRNNYFSLQLIRLHSLTMRREKFTENEKKLKKTYNRFFKIIFNIESTK